MDNTQNLGQPVGKVTTTYNGEKIQVNVYADRSVILPDGTVRKVKQEVVDALIAKNQAMNPASTIVRMAPAKPRMTQPEPSQEQVQHPPRGFRSLRSLPTSRRCRCPHSLSSLSCLRTQPFLKCSTRTSRSSRAMIRR